MDNEQETVNLDEQDYIDIPLPSERFDLEFIGKDWQGAYIEYIPFTGYEVEALQDVTNDKAIGKLYENASKAIVGGKIPSKSRGLVDINNRNFRSLPHKYVLKFYNTAISGELEENLEK